MTEKGNGSDSCRARMAPGSASAPVRLMQAAKNHQHQTRLAMIVQPVQHARQNDAVPDVQASVLIGADCRLQISAAAANRCNSRHRKTRMIQVTLTQLRTRAAS